MKPHIRKLSNYWVATGWGMVAYAATPAQAYDKLWHYMQERVKHQRQDAEYSAMLARLRISGVTAL